MGKMVIKTSIDAVAYKVNEENVTAIVDELNARRRWNAVGELKYRPRSGASVWISWGDEYDSATVNRAVRDQYIVFVHNRILVMDEDEFLTWFPDLKEGE